MGKIAINPFTGQFDLLGGGASLSVGAAIAGANPRSVLVTDSSTTLQDVGTMTDGQLVIGSTGNTPVRSSLTGTTNQITVTPGAGSITLSLPQDINTTATPTFTTVIANVDKTGSLNIGGTNATTLNLGNSTSGASVLGTLNLNSHLITNVTDPVYIQDAATKNFVDNSISALSLVYIPLTQRAANNGVATLDAGGKIPASQLPNSVMEFKGVYDPNTNTPSLADGTGNTGDTYVANAGTHDFGSGAITFADGDYVVYNGSIYQKSINSNNIASVNGQQGVVVLGTDQIAEGVTNLYYLDSRVSSYLSGAVSTITTSNLTVSRALTSDVSGKVAVSAVTSTELGYLSGTTSAVQTQLGNKADTTLGNLASVAINASLLPATSSSINLGSTTKLWNDVFVNNAIKNLNDIKVVDIGLFTLTDSSDVSSLRFNTRLLIDAGGVNALKYATRELTNTSGTTVLDWSGTDVSLNTRKLTSVVDPSLAQDAATKNYVDTTTVPSVAGDIPHTSFSVTNNQSSAADVTGFTFSNATVRSFKAQISAYINATSSLYETFDIIGIQKGASWEMSVQSTGDSSGILFTITSAGQMQYTSSNYAGFVAGTIKFRALVTSV